MKKFFPHLIKLISTIVIGITLYSLIPAEFFRVHDYTQGARIIEMFRGMQDGQIPVRWSQNFGYGYGMPTFLFYAPFPYLIGAAIYWFTQDIVFASKALWALPSIISFVGMYHLTKKYFGTWGALIAATSFTLAPYRGVDLYVRGAIGEIWGISFFPWLLLFVDQWFETKPKIDFKLSFLTGILLITHNVMALFFLPVLFVYAVLKWCFSLKKNISDLFFVSLQFLLGLGLSAFFVIPALLEKGYTQIEERILSGYFSYTQHFVYIRQFFQENWKYGGSQYGPNDDISFFLGYGQFIGLTVLAFVLLFWFYTKLRSGKVTFQQVVSGTITRHKDKLPLIILSGIFFPVSLFLCIGKSEFVWRLSSLLQSAQFPWRFLSLTIFCLAILNGLIFRLSLSEKFQKILFVLFILVLTIPAVKYFQPERFLDTPKGLYYTDAHLIRFMMSETWPDFLPKGFNNDIEPTDTRYQLPAGADPKDAELQISRSHQVSVQTHFKAPTQFILNIADFPGWTTLVDGEVVPHINTFDGLIQLTVPSGEHVVGADLQGTPIRLIADMITVVTLCIVLWPQIYLPGKKQRI